MHQWEWVWSTSTELTAFAHECTLSFSRSLYASSYIHFPLYMHTHTHTPFLLYTMLHIFFLTQAHTPIRLNAQKHHTRCLTLNTICFSAVGRLRAGTQKEASTSWSRVVSSRTPLSGWLTSCCRGRAWADRWLESSWGTASCSSTEMSSSESS